MPICAAEEKKNNNKKKHVASADLSHAFYSHPREQLPHARHFVTTCMSTHLLLFHIFANVKPIFKLIASTYKNVTKLHDYWAGC